MNIKDKIAFIVGSAGDLHRRFEREQKILVDELKHVQDHECKHEEILHAPDASGNHDSYDICKICGKVL